MRVISGQYKGQALLAPQGQQTRPTADSLRETLFNILDHSFTQSYGHCVDFFAGTGALGIEALSRGAESCIFFESDSKALQCIHRNLEKIQQPVEIIKNSRLSSWKLALQQSSFRPIHTVFCDPPYQKNLVQLCFNVFEGQEDSFFHPSCIWIAEIGAKETQPQTPFWECVQEKSRGASQLLFYRRRGC